MSYESNKSGFSSDRISSRRLLRTCAKLENDLLSQKEKIRSGEETVDLETYEMIEDMEYLLNFVKFAQEEVVDNKEIFDFVPHRRVP